MPFLLLPRKSKGFWIYLDCRQKDVPWGIAEVFAHLLKGTPCCHRHFGPGEVSQRACPSHTCNEPGPGLGHNFTLVNKTPPLASSAHNQLKDERRTLGLPHFRRIWPTPEVFRMWVNGLNHLGWDFLWVGENISGEHSRKPHRMKPNLTAYIFL